VGKAERTVRQKGETKGRNVHPLCGKKTGRKRSPVKVSGDPNRSGGTVPRSPTSPGREKTKANRARDKAHPKGPKGKVETQKCGRKKVVKGNLRHHVVS